MPELFYLVSKWWKQLLIFVLISLGIVAGITFIMSRQYLSVVTALPASPVLTDKGSVFNEHIEALYSNLGSGDDLDRIVGMAKLDTVYLAITDQFNLFDHYKISTTSEHFREKAADRLKENSKVYKSGYGELKIKVWDTDKNLAPQLANAILDKLQATYLEIQNHNNRAVLKSLQSARERTSADLDSLTATSSTNNMAQNRQQFLADQMLKYDQLINEYNVILDNKPPVLMVVEKATPAILPDRPKRLRIMVATFMAALIFSVLLALFLERKNERTT